MQGWRSMMDRLNNRNTIVSLLALGAAGATAISLARRRNGNGWRQMIQPLRRMF